MLNIFAKCNNEALGHLSALQRVHLLQTLLFLP